MASAYEILEFIWQKQQKNIPVSLKELFSVFGGGLRGSLWNLQRKGALQKYTRFLSDEGVSSQDVCFIRKNLKIKERAPYGKTFYEISERTLKWFKKQGVNSFLETNAAKNLKKYRMNRDWLPLFNKG